MTTKVKICGVKTLESAHVSIEAGADFLGFNFVPISKRYIKPAVAKKIGSQLRLSDIKTVGVFQNEKIDVVNKLINYIKLDYVQLHGDESAGYARQVNEALIIKTFSLSSDFDVEEIIKKMKKYTVDYFLLDREKQGKGELVDPAKIYELSLVFPIILAGGLTVENIANIVKLAKPQVVDVAGGVETNGDKDKEKIIEFIKNAKNYD